MFPRRGASSHITTFGGLVVVLLIGTVFMVAMWGRSSSIDLATLSAVQDGDFIEHVYVVPGGGTRDKAHAAEPDYGYPEWTKRRAAMAHAAYTEDGGRGLFLCLSAGSLNAPSARAAGDGKVVFESSHTLRHLRGLGVPENHLFGDWMSWDTVGNALALRMFVEAILARPVGESVLLRAASAKPPPLVVDVYISDFHAERVRAACEWLLGLSPPIHTMRGYELRIHVVDSDGIEWPDQTSLAERQEHEAAGLQQIRDNAARITTLPAFLNFYMLGGHRGLRNYLFGQYTGSKGGGWGG